MTVPLWVSIAVAMLAGIFGGVIGPLVSDRLQRGRWRTQKRFELQYDAFRGALDALAAWEADALDANLQNTKPTYKGAARVTEMRPSTAQALQHYHGLIHALFSAAVFSTYDTTLKSRVSIEELPFTEFEERRKAFVVAAASEIGLMNKPRVA